jgi:2-dehydro-3-deoxyphosphooctonate aldolase (KDO 8-P synthase)
MKTFEQAIQLSEQITLGGDKPVLIAGPCAAESLGLMQEVAGNMQILTAKLGFQYIFKASFDKANRTSVNSYRGPGMEQALQWFAAIRKMGLPILTDVHETHQVAAIAAEVDVLQIPAFLCRQTDLIKAAAESGKAVNIKRGQFMAPADMQYAVTKVHESGNKNAFLTERGASFGYHNLVVDMRALPIMRQYAPVVFDVTHSVQQPGGAGGSSGGQREFAQYLARAAAATGVDGFFIETHPNPTIAKSDGPNMVPLHEMEAFLTMLKEVWEVGRKYA